MECRCIAVFCGSKNGSDPIYWQHAAILGRVMAERKIKLVYGGGSKGLMGAVADAVMENGGEVTGVIPELLIGWEHQHEGITDLRVVVDMHIRKKMMYELCDAAIILPGGNGTLDELFEMLTWNTLEIHDKKVILLNSNGYYDHLVAHVQKMHNDGFLYENWEDKLIVCSDPFEAINVLLNGAGKTRTLP